MVNRYYIIKTTMKDCKKKVRERYQNLSKEEKNKRQKKAQEGHQNFTEEEKEKKH